MASRYSAMYVNIHPAAVFCYVTTVHCIHTDAAYCYEWRGLYVCLMVTTISAKTARPFELPFYRYGLACAQ